MIKYAPMAMITAAENIIPEEHWKVLMKPTGLYNIYQNQAPNSTQPPFYGEHGYSGSYIWYGFWSNLKPGF